MTSTVSRTLLMTAAMVALTGCNKTANTSEKVAESGNTAAPAATDTSATSGDPVKSAESAAPAAIVHNASIVTVDSSGAMKELRKGSNGWTCMPDAPETPGPDPMCFDANAGKWVDAWAHHKTPPAGAVGLMYMLEGGTDASNTDPYAKQPTSQNNWIKTGPHVMIVGAKEILANYPHDPSPDTSGPYVMWAGTPYEHLMVPVTK